MKATKLLLASLAASVVFAEAGSINIGNIAGGGPGSDAVITGFGGNTPLLGGIVAAGFFATTTDLVVDDIGTVGDLVTLFASMTQMTSTTMGQPTGDAGAFFTGTNYAGGLYEANLGKSIYLVIFNGAQDQGLLIKTGQSIGADTGTSIDSNDFGVTAAANIILGSLGPQVTVNWENAIGNAAYTTDSIRLAGVPEPSAALLGAIGALGLLRRRRN